MERVEQPVEVAQVPGAERLDGGEQDALTGLERPLGDLAPGRLEPHQRPAPSARSGSRRARPAASSRSTTRTARECETRIAPARTSTELPSAHSYRETSAAGRPPAIPVASSVASLMPSLSVRASDPRRFATAKIYASGIHT